MRLSTLLPPEHHVLPRFRRQLTLCRWSSSCPMLTVQLLLLTHPQCLEAPTPPSSRLHRREFRLNVLLMHLQLLLSPPSPLTLRPLAQRIAPATSTPATARQRARLLLPSPPLAPPTMVAASTSRQAWRLLLSSPLLTCGRCCVSRRAGQQGPSRRQSPLRLRRLTRKTRAGRSPTASRRSPPTSRAVRRSPACCWSGGRCPRTLQRTLAPQPCVLRPPPKQPCASGLAQPRRLLSRRLRPRSRASETAELLRHLLTRRRSPTALSRTNLRRCLRHSFEQPPIAAYLHKRLPMWTQSHFHWSMGCRGLGG